MGVMLILLVPLLLGWVAVAIVVGYVASQRGRNGFAFFFLSLFLSPLVGFAVLALLPPAERIAKPAALAWSKRRRISVGIGVVVVAAALFYYLPDYLPVPPLSYYLPVRTAPPSTQSAPPVVYSPADIARGKCQSEAARSGDTPGTTDRLSRCLEAADALYK